MLRVNMVLQNIAASFGDCANLIEQALNIPDTFIPEKDEIHQIKILYTRTVLFLNI